MGTEGAELAPVRMVVAGSEVVEGGLDGWTIGVAVAGLTLDVIVSVLWDIPAGVVVADPGGKFELPEEDEAVTGPEMDEAGASTSGADVPAARETLEVALVVEEPLVTVESARCP